MASNECFGTHHFFVAKTGEVEAEGKVVLIAMCTSCGETRVSEHKVAQPKKDK